MGYLFAKQDRANIEDDELADFRKLVKAYAGLTTHQVNQLMRTTGWRFAMATKRKFKTEAFEAIHSSASAMYKVGAIDKETMRSFDSSCLAAPPRLKPEQIKKLRQRLRVSQPVFARYLNTSESTIEKWETGAKQPSGMALKLLSVVEKHGLEALA